MYEYAHVYNIHTCIYIFLYVHKETVKGHKIITVVTCVHMKLKPMKKPKGIRQHKYLVGGVHTHTHSKRKTSH